MFEIFNAALHGATLSLGLIIPLGMQNIFIFNQGATHPHLKKALPSILTAALCDTLLICLAVLGLSLLVVKISWLRFSIFVIGFVFLLYMGYNAWNTSSIDMDDATRIRLWSTKKQILFAASVSILNPHAIIDTVAVIGSNSFMYNGNSKIAFTIACIVISWIWFFTLALLGYRIKKLNKTGLLKVINKISAIIIWTVACYIGVQIIHQIY